MVHSDKKKSLFYPEGKQVSSSSAFKKLFPERRKNYSNLCLKYIIPSQVINIVYITEISG